MFRNALIGFIISVVFCDAAYAAGVQAQCGNESGRAFAVAQGVVRADHAGWYDDQMTGETVIRVNTSTGEVDVRFKDASGTWQAVTDNGGTATLFSAQGDPASFMILVSYPGGTIETLTLAGIRQSNATLIHTVSRTTPLLTNSRVMTAACEMSSY